MTDPQLRGEETLSMTGRSGPVIIGFGEALFDLFPHGAVLGGAPLNFAVHAHQLLQPLGGAGAILSRIGMDALGRELHGELSRRGMTSRYVQVDPEHRTGTVTVTLAGREPHYEIARDVAWDYIEFNDQVEDLAHACKAVCFGTLAQRSVVGRATLHRFLKAAAGALRLFDVNLRQSYYSPELLHESCINATAVKLNEHECLVIARALQLPAAYDDPDRCLSSLMDRYRSLHVVALTRGARGTVLFTRAGRFEGQVPSFPNQRNANSVGAGDACSAAIAVGMVLGWPGRQIVDLANSLGAYTAASAGATPTLPESLLRMVRVNAAESG